LEENGVFLYEFLEEVLPEGHFPSFPSSSTEHQWTSEITVTKKQTPVPSVTGTICMHGPAIKHRKNELFLDIIEEVTAVFSESGTVEFAQISGHIQCVRYATTQR
jgi:hypothetical protein